MTISVSVPIWGRKGARDVLAPAYSSGALPAIVPFESGLASPGLPSPSYRYSDTAVPLPAHFLASVGGASMARFDNTPAANPITDAGATLGRVLFYDTRLSKNGGASCASCHHQSLGFARRAPFPRRAWRTLRANQFLPRSVVVPPGATVSFHSVDNARHNATFDNPAVGATPRFTSGVQTITMPTALDAYTYHCTVHGPAMSGSIVVGR